MSNKHTSLASSKATIRLAVTMLLVSTALSACNIPGLGGSGQQTGGLVTQPPPTNAPPPIPTKASMTQTTTPTLTLTHTSTPTDTPTSTPTDTPTFTSVPTNTPVPPPTNTPVPPATAVPATAAAPSATPGSVQPGPEGNRLNNPGFEGDVRPVIFGEVKIFEGWEPFYCDEPYTPNKCAAPKPCAPGQTTSCNPVNEFPFMKRPEYKSTKLDYRVHSGSTAQQWFCFAATCQAGVFQTFSTSPGEICEVGAYVQSWANFDSDLASDGLDTQDGKDTSQWYIKVDPTGGTYAFANGILVSRVFNYDDGHYDKYVKISFVFTATSTSATVFFENLRIWPVLNNDNYIDDAYAHCRAP